MSRPTVLSTSFVKILELSKHPLILLGCLAVRSISLDNIVELSATFLQLKDEERALPWYRRGGTKKRQIDTLQGERDALKQKYVDQLLNQFDRVNVVPKMNDSLSLLRQKADSS